MTISWAFRRYKPRKLDAIDDSLVSVSAKTSIKAKAHFLRGYYYYLLVSNRGGVPLRLHATNSVDDAIFLRSSVAEVYGQVLQDMTNAETVLPTITKLGANGSGSMPRSVFAWR